MIFLFAGCGRVSFELTDAPEAGGEDAGRVDGGLDAGLDAGALDAGPLDASRDAGLDASPDAGLDASPDAGTIVWTDRPLCGFAPGGWTLTPPAPVAELNTPFSDLETHLHADGRTLFLANDTLGRFAVFVTTRAGLGAPFGPPTAVAGLSEAGTQNYHFAPYVDLLRGVVASTRSGTGGRADIFLVERASTADPWAVTTPVGAVNTAGDEHDPWLSPDGLRLYYVSHHPHPISGTQALWVAERASLDAPFAAGRRIEELDTPANEDNPALTSDELTIVFGSDRAGGLGDHDLWIASRASRSDPFGPPAPLEPANSPQRDAESHISFDGCELFLSSWRGGSGADIYVSRIVAR